MLSKKDFITELYKRIIKDVTSDSVAWRAFLHSALVARASSKIQKTK